MVDRDDFIEYEIKPIFESFASDFDIDGIMDELIRQDIVTFDGVNGFKWKEKTQETSDRFWEIVPGYDMSVLTDEE